ncbi:MAG: hypothetical protein IRZ02_06335 [Acidothermus sp.]|nr:hypothetical protein [Acidothermus sp.]
MTLRMVAGRPIAEDAEDLRHWLSSLTGCPSVTRAVLATCEEPVHDEPLTWFYVEADAQAGVARRRCLGCGRTRHLLDSEEHWTAPHMWQCPGCGQSIAEVAVGLHEADERVEWVVVAARCVECGMISGLTDVLVDRLPLDEVLSRV